MAGERHEWAGSRDGRSWGRGAAAAGRGRGGGGEGAEGARRVFGGLRGAGWGESGCWGLGGCWVGVQGCWVGRVWVLGGLWGAGWGFGGDGCGLEGVLWGAGGLGRGLEVLVGGLGVLAVGWRGGCGVRRGWGGLSRGVLPGGGRGGRRRRTRSLLKCLHPCPGQALPQISAPRRRPWLRAAPRLSWGPGLQPPVGLGA